MYKEKQSKRQEKASNKPQILRTRQGDKDPGVEWKQRNFSNYGNEKAVAIYLEAAPCSQENNAAQDKNQKLLGCTQGDALFPVSQGALRALWLIIKNGECQERQTLNACKDHVCRIDDIRRATVPKPQKSDSANFTNDSMWWPEG
uniref:Uncharacterized protein n=1 Tax=Glossina austeni TaxID=7395 RepID=A0A1A9V9E8_GLOAU